LCAALALARRGIKAIVVDEAWRPASHSYGVALHPHSLDVLGALGVLPALLPRGQRVDGIYLYEGAEQRAWMSLAGAPVGHPFVLAVPQAILEEELVAALQREDVTVLWNHRIAALDTTDAPDGRPTVILERLVKESGGYGTSTTSWVIDKTWTLTPGCVIGADGYDSMVRRSLGIELEPLAAPLRYLSVEVSGSDRGGGYDLRVILGETYTDAVWPLQDGGCRCTLQLPLDGMRWRSKQRARWAAPARHSPDLDALLAQRLPWLDERAAIGWAGSATFEPSLAKSYGRGRVWLAGDAAHVASPLGVQSLNMGLREAYGLATVIAEHLGQRSTDGFAEYEDGFREEWRRLLGAVPLVAADPWLQRNAARLVPAMPATGEALAHLLRRLGVQASPARRGKAHTVDA
jgi:2-polyprenyl-6-methoxyphenol hydroxylase-like FAD-dependent oxidoreductase